MNGKRQIAREINTMKKILIISAIVLVVIVGLFENIGEDIPEEEVNAKDTKTEETASKSQSESTDEEKEEAKHKHEEQKAKEEQAAKEEQEAKQKEEEEKEAQAKAEEEEKQRKENEAKEKAEQEAAEQEAAEQEDAETIYLQVMRENVGSYVDIQFDKTEKTYVMTATDQGLIDEISMLPMGIGHEDWGVLVDGMTSMSASGKDLVGEGYSINLVNPLNHENVILWIVDGEVIYNVIDDL